MRPLAAAGAAAGISATDASDVWAVGEFLPQGGYEQAFTQFFDGTQWRKGPTGGVALTAVKAFSKSDAWAVGIEGDEGFVQTLAVHWDGTSWRAIRTADATNDDNFTAVDGVSSDDLWAVGSTFEPASHRTVTLAEHWNGRAWSIVKTQDVALQNILLGVYAAKSDDVWAVGYIDNVGGSDGDMLIEHWDGSRWSIIPPPNTPFKYNAELIGVGGASADDIWAVGAGFRAPNTNAETVTVHWNGTRWQYVASPNVGTEYDMLSGVAVATSGAAVAVGSSMNATDTLIMRWEGKRWVVDRSAISPRDSQLNAVSIGADGSLWTAGYAGSRPFDEFSCVR